MGRPEKEVRCRKHRSHKNMDGVCPYCLRDRLEKLSGWWPSPENYPASISASDSSDYSAYSSYESESSSSFASPPPERRRRSRLLQLLKGRKTRKEMGSSKSFSFGSDEAAEKSGGVKKEGGGAAGRILAKLGMVGAAKRLLTHSKTVKERSSSKWKIF